MICRIVSSDVLRLASVQFVVEDIEGNVGPVNLYNLPSGSPTSLYAKGEYFGGSTLVLESLRLLTWLPFISAIKEPDVRSSSLLSSPSFIIRIDSPTDLVRLSPRSALLAHWSTTKGPSTSLSAHKSKGNEYFKQGSWLEAFASYTKGLEAGGKGEDVVALRSNRAQTLLNLNRPGAALRDCTSALLDPFLSHQNNNAKVSSLRQKILYRSGLAEYRLGRYSQAFSRLEFLLKLIPNDTTALELLDRTKSRIQESVTGIFDWPSLFSTKEPLDIADYVGSMITHINIEGKGRGLVATRDIEPGELLLVSKPLASSKGTPDATKFLVGINMFTKTMDPYPQTNLVPLLIEKMIDDPAVIPLVFDLHPGASFYLNGFDYGATRAVDEEGFDISRLEGITTFNSFHPEALVESETLEEEKENQVHSPSAIYHYPSFMNHSCVGNVSYSFIQDVLFMRCRLPIKKGRELVDTYVEAVLPLESRKDTFRKHNFVCKCELCTLDEADGKKARELRQKMGLEIEEITNNIYQFGEETTLKSIEGIRKLLRKFKETYKDGRILRPEMYKVTRLLAAELSKLDFYAEATEVELFGLNCLGAYFEGSKALTKTGDVNAILSCLFIAKMFVSLSKEEEAR